MIRLFMVERLDTGCLLTFGDRLIYNGLAMLKAQETFGVGEKREALEVVLRSQCLSRSDTLRALLSYVCEMEIAGREAEISEYSIAVDGLGRPKMYSAAEDSSVRNRVHALRKKLDELYRTELANETVRIELAKGTYCPRFVRVQESTSAVVVEPAAPVRMETVIPPAAGRMRANWKAFTAGAGLALAIAAIAYFMFGVKRIDPVLKEAWGPLVAPNANVAVVIGMGPALAIRAYEQAPREFDGVAIAPVPADLYPWYSRRQTVPAGQKLFLVPTQTNPSMGTVLGAASVAGFLTAAGASYEVLSESLVPMGAIRNRNVILMGAPEHSETMRRVTAGAPFEIVYDRQGGDYAIVERDGKKRKFATVRDGSGKLTQAYGLVTVLPSEGSDGQRRSIFLAGTYSAGISAAADFFCSPVKMNAFQRLLEKEEGKGFPAAYQMVIRAHTDHTLPLGNEYAAHRVMP